MIRLTPAPRALAASSLLVLLAAACSGDGPSLPEQDRVAVAALAGDQQLGAAGVGLLEPLQAVVTDAVSEDPVKGVRVRFVVREGSGATLTPAEATTDAQGVASAGLVLGAALGSYVVEATAEGMVGEAARFTAEAVPVPKLAGVEPAAAAAGDTVLLTGADFRTAPAENRVVMAGLDAEVVSATPTALRAVVPACVPNRTVNVSVHVGSAGSASRSLASTAGAPDVALAPGEVHLVEPVSALACVRLAGAEGGAGYLVTVVNTADFWAPATTFQLAGVPPGTAVVTAPALWAAAPAVEPSLAFEARLRTWERTFPAGSALRAPEGMAAVARVPVVGEQASFNVINRENRFEGVTAEVKAVSQRAVIYQDVEAPAGGFTTAEFEAFGALFDDPIHATVVEAYGEPSDIDANGRITILLTPKVNALTEANQSSFIAGYFFGCDLVSKEACAGTNRGEIFYSMVPDPTGTFGNVRSKQLVLRTVPGVLAHEFQHMINFNVKGRKLDALWLSEALAHMAEDLVGRELLARDRVAEATDFLLPNWNRARQYLSSPASVSLLADESPGTLEFRGGAWLLLKYAMGHHGGDTLLGNLARSPLTSVANFEAGTGQPWEATLPAFFVALWADGAPQLQAAVPVRYTFPNMDLRGDLGSSGGFPLTPPSSGFVDFSRARLLPAASFDAYRFDAVGFAPAYHLVVSGGARGPLPPAARAALVVLRYR